MIAQTLSSATGSATLRPPLRRRCAMGEPLAPIRNCGGCGTSGQSIRAYQKKVPPRSGRTIQVEPTSGRWAAHPYRPHKHLPHQTNTHKRSLSRNKDKKRLCIEVTRQNNRLPSPACSSLTNNCLQESISESKFMRIITRPLVPIDNKQVSDSSTMKKSL